MPYVGNRVLFGTHWLISRWPTAKFPQRRDKVTDEERLHFESKIIIPGDLYFQSGPFATVDILAWRLRSITTWVTLPKMIRVAEQAFHIFLSLSYFNSQNRDIDHRNNQNRPSGLPPSLAWGHCTPLFFCSDFSPNKGKPFTMRVYVGTPDIWPLELQVSVFVRC